MFFRCEVESSLTGNLEHVFFVNFRNPNCGDPTTGHRGSASANEFQDLVDQDNGERESQHQDPVVEC